MLNFTCRGPILVPLKNGKKFQIIALGSVSEKVM